MNNRARKKKAAQEHNEKYQAEKARLAQMSDDEIRHERLSRAVAKATNELMPQAHNMLTNTQEE